MQVLKKMKIYNETNNGLHYFALPACMDFEYTCPSGIPHCILRDNVCDGSNHCADGADEKNCTKTTCPDFKVRSLGNMMFG